MLQKTDVTAFTASGTFRSALSFRHINRFGDFSLFFRNAAERPLKSFPRIIIIGIAEKPPRVKMVIQGIAFRQHSCFIETFGPSLCTEPESGKAYHNRIRIDFFHRIISRCTQFGKPFRRIRRTDVSFPDSSAVFIVSKGEKRRMPRFIPDPPFINDPAIAFGDNRGIIGKILHFSRRKILLVISRITTDDRIKVACPFRRGSQFPQQLKSGVPIRLQFLVPELPFAFPRFHKRPADQVQAGIMQSSPV